MREKEREGVCEGKRGKVRERVREREKVPVTHHARRPAR